jgi:hypothetical protein
MSNKNSKSTCIGDFTAKERTNKTKFKKRAEMQFLIEVEKHRMNYQEHK